MTPARQDGREPPPADTWQSIRAACDRHMPRWLVCMYPWCGCDLVDASAELNAAADWLRNADKARGEVA